MTLIRWQRPSQARAHLDYLDEELRELDADPERPTLDYGICASHLDAIREVRRDIRVTKAELAILEKRLARAA